MVEWWLWRHHLHEIHENGVYRVTRLSPMFGKLMPVGYYLQGEELHDFMLFRKRLESLRSGEGAGH